MTDHNSDADSDLDFADYDSSPSSPHEEHPKHSTSILKTSVDRLYALPSTKPHFTLDSERSSLLSRHDGVRSYLSSPGMEIPDPFETSLSSPRPLGMLTRKISRVFQSKAYDYDSNKNSLAAVGSGERVW